MTPASSSPRLAYWEVARKILADHPDIFFSNRERQFVEGQAASHWSFQTKLQEEWLRRIARRAEIEW